MGALRCPKCEVALTNDEAESGVCPCCKAALPQAIMRAGAQRLFRSSPVGPASGTSGGADADHLPGLARVARWMIRISAAGMIFLVAGCFATTILSALFLPANLSGADRNEIVGHIMFGLGALFLMCFVSLIIGTGLKVLAGD